MNKRSRFIIILVVLAMCFAFLWPSISWYARTPKDQQSLALGSLEKIKDYTIVKAKEESDKLIEIARANPETVLDSSYDYLVKAAKKNYKEIKKAYNAAKMEAPETPSVMTVGAILDSFAGSNASDNLRAVIEAKYRDEILAAKKRYNSSVKLGLDLSGGMNIIIRAKLDEALAAKKAEGNEIANEAQWKKDAMAQTIETLTGSIDKFGLTSPVVRQQGDDHIYIEIPGAADRESVNTIIMGKGMLNFRLVDRNATNAFNAYYVQNPASTFNSDGKLIDPTIIPEDTEVMGYYVKDDYGLDERTGFVVVKKEIALEGEHIKSADVSADQTTNQPEVVFSLDSEGAVIFGEFTAAHKNEQLAIVSDNKVKSAPNIQSAINNGQVRITGGFSIEEAQNLQKVLQTASLSVPLEVESQQVVGAALGENAIKQGINALLWGLIAVLLFMILYYLGAGFNAVVAQILNMYIMFSILSAFNYTLTLSSIAGMILTVGMSVDANVIIFERIKEIGRASCRERV